MGQSEEKEKWWRKYLGGEIHENDRVVNKIYSTPSAEISDPNSLLPKNCKRTLYWAHQKATWPMRNVSIFFLSDDKSDRPRDSYKQVSWC